jgi:excisionase family DNA binding protein
VKRSFAADATVLTSRSRLGLRAVGSTWIERRAVGASRTAAINRSGTRADSGRGPDTVGIRQMETANIQTPAAEPERLAYSLQEAAELLGIDYFSVYRLIQRGKLRACRALRGKLLVPRSELLRLLNN